MRKASVWTRSAGAVGLMAAAFCLGSAPGGAQEAPQETKKEGEKKDPAKAPPEVRDLRLTLVVVASGDPSPVNRANVTIFCGEEPGRRRRAAMGA
jgi:hypothetical protein